MRSFVAELQRRNVIRAAAFYAASAWLLVQVATQVFPFFSVPNWAVRWIVIAAVVGFPFMLLFAWFYEFTPHGLKRESEIDPDESTTRQTGRKLDRWIIAVMAAAIVLLLTNQFVLRKDDTVQPVVSTTPAKSIAVLPFTDLSPAHDQEYFSDGVAEELLNALAKLKDLKVAGRTSSFSFKGKNEDLRVIGKALSVANILEGSLRKQGDKVRITAQLIQVSDGFHLWSETYDGDLSDVFALQENIARAIAEKLEIVLQGDAAQRIVPVPTTNPEAHALYLQATGIFNRREGARFPDAIAQLEQAIKLDPKFARAHARLAAVVAIAPTYTVIDPIASVASAEEHARIASELDPGLAEPYGALGQSLSIRRRFLEARAAFERARELDPDDTTSTLWYSTELIMTGYRKQGNAMLDHLLEIDPMLPTALLWRGASYAYAGDMENAERLLSRAADAKLVFAGLGLSFIDDARHETAAAIEELSTSFKSLDTILPKDAPDVLAAGILGDGSARARALEMIDRLIETKPPVVPGLIVYALMRMDEPARAVAIIQNGITSNDAVFLSLMWSPYGRNVRALPEFPEFARKIGFADVWEKYGAPDDCRRVAPRDYLCE
jgi:TolB-like protein/Tfp pilus assembly protein PilF